MGTAVAPPITFVKPVATLPGRRFDHVFFSSTALLMLASVFVGFAPTYYLAGVFNAPLPNTIIHIHGAVFPLGSCCWSRKRRWYQPIAWTFTRSLVLPHLCWRAVWS
ncbi:MAG: hypothetical protein ACXVK3_15010 [Candidatus Angelobacter sp.]